MLLAVGKCAYFVAIVINKSIYNRVSGDVQFLPDNFLVFIANGIQNDLICTVAYRTWIRVTGNVLYSEIRHIGSLIISLSGIRKIVNIEGITNAK